MGNINSAIEQSSLPDPNPTFDAGLPIVNESNEDAKKVRYIMNKLTYVSFHKLWWEQPSGEVVNLVAVLLQIY